MNRELNILILEDTATDAALTKRELSRAKIAFCSRCVETREAFLAALDDFAPDLILADYSLPTFDGLSALTIAQEKCPEIPFIFVSGSIGEETAIETLKRGATDYVLKHRLGRLEPAVRRALREAEERAERQRAEAALRESEERYALAVHGANDGLWDWNLKTNEIYFSPRWKTMLGCEEHEISHCPDEWFNRIHPEDVRRVRAELDAHLAGMTPHFQNEYRVLHKDGTCRWVLSRGIAVRDADGQTCRVAGSQTDVTERKIAEEQLLRNAFYDALTGLPNRALFIDRLGRAIEFAKRYNDYLFAALFLDSDRFKIVNDSLGHLIGDQLLIAIAQRLKAGLSFGDTVARLGGDEFAILLEDIKDVGGATRVADQIQKALRRPFNLNGQEVFITASIGITLSTTGYDRPEDLLRDAETAMYRAKALGKARYEVFDLGMQGRTLALLQLEVDLRRAVEGEGFEAHYQPIVSLASGEVASVETLLRWKHPRRGFVSPAEFIPLAEETGLIGPIGEWVLRTTCAHHQTWRSAGLPPLRTAINVSALQFQRPNLPLLIGQVLKQCGLTPHCLELEITESIAMQDIAYSIATFNELVTMGIQISIDDFGTGYSSLAYLKRFPIQAIKIDQSFVHGILTDPNDRAIISATIAMAHSLKLKVIAEGVETEEQLAFLRSQQCDEAQGNFFSRPVPADTLAALLMDSEFLEKCKPMNRAATSH